MPKGGKDLHHTDASTTTTTTTKQKKKTGLNPNKLGEKVWGRRGEGCAGTSGWARWGEERSGWVSHIHTLGVETGY